jgi:hypothetical protein
VWGGGERERERRIAAPLEYESTAHSTAVASNKKRASLAHLRACAENRFVGKQSSVREVWLC